MMPAKRQPKKVESSNNDNEDDDEDEESVALDENRMNDRMAWKDKEKKFTGSALQ
jgi:hypothetical protein